MIKNDDPEIYFRNFLQKLNEIFQESYPIKTKFVTPKYFNNPWYTKDVKKLSEARIKYHKLHLLGLVTREQYSTFRNRVTNLIRKYKEKYYSESFKRSFNNVKKHGKQLGKYVTENQ